MKEIKILILLASLAWSLSAINCTADNLVQQDAGAWVQAVGEGSLKFIDPSLEKARIWLEGQSHWDDDWYHWSQSFLRVALGYSLTQRATIWVGYTWVPNQTAGKPFISQQDVWPGFRYILPTEYGTVVFRTLLESNFIRGNDVRFHPRQMVRFAHPFDFEPRFSLVVWDEVFFRVNTTQYGGRAGYDQNRAFGGVGWTFNPNVTVELGYLNHDVDDANHINNTMHHIIQGSVFVNF